MNPDPAPVPEEEGFRLDQLVAGSPSALQWLRQRCERRAAPRFSAWAWEWLREDFVADLLLQLTVTAGKPDFVLRGRDDAYVDICIFNLCRRTYTDLAAVRRGDDLTAHEGQLRAPRSDVLEYVAIALDMRQALAALHPECPDLLFRKSLEGATLEEMGDVAGVPARTMRSRLHACRRRLRSIWDRQLGSPPEGSSR